MASAGWYAALLLRRLWRPSNRASRAQWSSVIGGASAANCWISSSIAGSPSWPIPVAHYPPGTSKWNGWSDGSSRGAQWTLAGLVLIGAKLAEERRKLSRATARDSSPLARK